MFFNLPLTTAPLLHWLSISYYLIKNCQKVKGLINKNDGRWKLTSIGPFDDDNGIWNNAHRNKRVNEWLNYMAGRKFDMDAYETKGRID